MPHPLTARLLALGVVLASLASAHAAVLIYLSPEGIAAAAPMAFEADVVAVDSGYDPVTARIATYVVLEATRILRGPLSPGRIVLRERGGVFGGLVHVAEGVPVYEPGQSLLVFAEAARDGALRTAGGFYGRFGEPAAAGESGMLERRLDGNGTILGKPGGLTERFSRDDIVRLATADSRSGWAERFVPLWLPEPEEFARLVWNGPKLPAEGAEAHVEFAPLSGSQPARWDEMDSGGTVRLDVERARDPLGDPAAAVQEIGRALTAWTSVPESRAALALGNADARFTMSSFFSPADVYPASNIVLFGDPYDDLPDPVSCSGTLAYGGYWRSATPNRTVNGVQYYPIRRAYVIFNRGFECFLASPKNLAEIATHEIGHALGFGHSSVPGAVMRAWPYGNRGAALDYDDRNAVHCVYPHAFTVAAPNGGEAWTPGAVQVLRWSSTSDGAASPGTVDIDLSVDAGGSWTAIAAGTPNDGTFEWLVPPLATQAARIRVVRRTIAGSAGPGVSVCSQDASNGTFTILPAPGPAGTIATGGAAPLRLNRLPSGEVELSWGAPCGAPSGYAVYEGSLSALREGRWDHAPVRCGEAALRSHAVSAAGGDRYYLVGALASVGEGSLGTRSDGTLRPESTSRCAVRASLRCP